MTADELAREYWYQEILPQMVGFGYEDDDVDIRFAADLFVQNAPYNLATMRLIIDWAREKGLA